MKKGLATCSGRATINVLDLDAMLNCERFFSLLLCVKRMIDAGVGFLFCVC